MEVKSMLSRTLYSKVRGISIGDRQHIVDRIPGNCVLELRREPLNAYDRNAIAVYFGADSIGYIAKELAMDLAGYIDRGGRVFAQGTVTGLGYETHGVNLNLELLDYHSGVDFEDDIDEEGPPEDF
jgi:hypothetical protein